MAILDKIKGTHSNNRSMRIRYNLRQIVLKQQLFSIDCFSTALSAYVHEPCHMFGGDASKSFSHALTDAIEIMVQNKEQICEAEAS